MRNRHATQTELTWEVLLREREWKRGGGRKRLASGDRSGRREETDRQTKTCLSLQKSSKKVRARMGRACLLKGPLHLCRDYMVMEQP